MQHRDNCDADADVAFLRDQVRLAQELAKRHIEFAIIPLMSCTEKDATLKVYVSKELQKGFLKCK